MIIVARIINVRWLRYFEPVEEEELDKIKKTLLVILKTRNQPSEIALLGLVNRWQPDEVEEQ